MLRWADRTARDLTLRQALTMAAIWVAIGAAVYLAYNLGLVQPAVSQMGSVTAKSAVHPAEKVTARTRRLGVRESGAGPFWQVEVSPGNWLDCTRDCAETLRHHAFQE
jgi:hypothetical protein